MKFTLNSSPMANVLLLLAFLGVLSSCKDYSRDDIKKQISETIEGIKTQSDTPLSEIEKLYQWEYKVLSYPLSTPAHSIEGSLNELGSKRWDCFHAEKGVESDRSNKPSPALLVFCKRLPETYLRYVPKQLIGR